MGLTPAQMNIAVRPLFDAARRNLTSNKERHTNEDKERHCHNCKQLLISDEELSGGYCEPCEIARARYVKGEITKKEYDEMMKTLREP